MNDYVCQKATFSSGKCHKSIKKWRFCLFKIKIRLLLESLMTINYYLFNALIIKQS